jgi:hypothetical protein
MKTPTIQATVHERLMLTKHIGDEKQQIRKVQKLREVFGLPDVLSDVAQDRRQLPVRIRLTAARRQEFKTAGQSRARHLSR